jgi:hypothetical protein
MTVQGPSHLVSGVSAVVADLDAASAVRPVTGLQQRGADMLLTTVCQD